MEEQIGILAKPGQSTALIAVTQLPIIEERLKDFKDEVAMVVAEAKGMVATSDTVQAVKTRRAELRKQFDALEEQRKAVKSMILAPYDRFNAVYKDCIEKPFSEADAALKTTVDGFESELKSKCRESLLQYFGELCSIHCVDFLTFDQAMAVGKLKIGMADANAKTPRRLMDGLSEAVAKVACDVETIDAMNSDMGSAVMAEYRVNGFNLAMAIKSVKDRMEQAAAEKEAAERRRSAQERQKEAVAKVEAVAPPRPTEAPKSATVAPEVLEERFDEFTFTVFNCTRTQLIKVREFLKQEGIQYE